MGEGEKRQFSPIRTRPTYFTPNGGIVYHCWWNSSKFWSGTWKELIWGYLRSQTVFFANRYLTHDLRELETWARSHCVCIVTTHWLICSINNLCQHVTNADLQSNADLIFLRRLRMYLLRRALTRGTRWRPNYVASFLTSNVIREKRYYQNWLFLRDRWRLIHSC